MSTTLSLDSDTWDLVLDANGDIQVATDADAMAQDAASECRLFQGDDYYDTTHGIPYWARILGQRPQLNLLRTYLVNAALLVPGVVSAKVFFSAWTGRTLSGQVQTTDAYGTTTAGTF